MRSYVRYKVGLFTITDFSSNRDTIVGDTTRDLQDSSMPSDTKNICSKIYVKNVKCKIYKINVLGVR